MTANLIIDSSIDPSVKIPRSVRIGHFCVIEKDVIIGANTSLGHGVILAQGTKIGRNCVIDSHAVLGKQPQSNKGFSTRTKEQPGTKIGAGVHVGVNTLIYAGVTVGKGSYIADNVSIREGSEIGNNVRVGRCVDIDDHAKIKDLVKIQSGALIADETIIEAGAYIGPQVTLTADKFMSRDASPRRGPHIKKLARIGANATILPKVIIGENAVIAAGSVVSHDIPSKTLAVGNPARLIKKA